MINAIAEIGRYEKIHNPEINSNFDIWLEDSFDERNYPHLLLIEFQRVEENGNKRWIFNQVDYYQHSSKFKSRILYKAGKGKNAPDTTPTSKVTEIEKTFNKKIKKWFQQNKKTVFLDANEKKFIQAIDSELEQKSDLIVLKLKEKMENLDKGSVISISFREDNNQKLLSDYPLFSKFINVISAEDYKYSKTLKTFSVGGDELCAICKQKQPEVFGYFTSLKFYNVDKPGMVTGGFDQSKSWKNYPICLNCALDVEMGIKVLDEKLTFNFYGLRYYLIPKITNENARDEILNGIFNFKNSPGIKDADRSRITNDEEEVFDYLKEKQNNVTFSLLFFDKPQKSVFRILSLIEDVLPSRLKQLFDMKESVDSLVFFREYKDGKQMIRFNYGTLRTFFPNSKIEGNHDKYFLELVEKTFSDTKIDYPFVIHHIIYHLRNLFVQDNSIWYQTLQSFMLILFLNKLNLFRFNHKEVEMDRQFYDSFEIKSKEDLETKSELFFENFKEFFLTDIHRSIFLIGVLSQFLLNIQSRERGATPFRSKLKGLKMDGRDITSLVPEIIDKLEQYKWNYPYIPLENLIAKYLLSAGDFRRWNLPVDEMNFIFVLGMNLSKYFKIKSENNKSQEA